MVAARFREIIAQTVFPEGLKERRRLEELAYTDSLTEVSNRLALDEALPSAERNPDISIIVFDANNFGRINKEFGQVRGDELIKKVADSIVLAAELRQISTRRVFRRGGDEFVVLAPRNVAEEIVKLAEEIFGIVDGYVSLSGVYADTFAEADRLLQPAKRIRKSQ